jgi:hypothetical protein
MSVLRLVIRVAQILPIVLSIIHSQGHVFTAARLVEEAEKNLITGSTIEGRWVPNGNHSF